MNKILVLSFFIIIAVFVGWRIVFAGYGGCPGGEPEPCDDCEIGSPGCGCRHDPGTPEYDNDPACWEGVNYLILTLNNTDVCGGKVLLKWNKYLGAITYVVYKVTDENQEPIMLAEVVELSYITTATYGDSFYVVAFGPEGSEMGETSISNYVMVKLSPRDWGVDPSPICSDNFLLTAITTSSCGSKVDLTFPAVAGTAKYAIYKNGQYLGYIDGDGMDEHVSEVPAGKYYTVTVNAASSPADVFKVYAFSASDAWDPYGVIPSSVKSSNEASACPSVICSIPAPVLMAATSDSCGGKVELSWSVTFGSLKLIRHVFLSTFYDLSNDLFPTLLGFKIFKNGELLTTTAATAYSFTTRAVLSDVFTVVGF